MIRHVGGSELKDGIRAADLLKRPEMTYEHIQMIAPAEQPIDPEVAEQVEIQIKYEGYIEKSLQQVEKLKKMENKKFQKTLITMRLQGWRQRRDKIKTSSSAFNCTSIAHLGSQSSGYFNFISLFGAGKIARVSNE